MMSRSPFRWLIFGAAMAFGLGGVAQARSHISHVGHGAGSPLGGSSMRHGTRIAFKTHQLDRLASRDYLGGRHAGRFHRGYTTAGLGGHSGGGIQCVTFARADSGIELTGNASAWWYNAAGVYQRGGRPEAGAVLNFRANGAMRLGHVAVVNQVIDARTIEIDHANWGGPGAVRGGISRDISVVDVSARNDWSAVRVALGHTGEYGSIYPTYGFIYNRADGGTMVASNPVPSAMPVLNPASRDLRAGMRDGAGDDEVAEAPDADPVAYYGHSRYHARHRRETRHRSFHGRG